MVSPAAARPVGRYLLFGEIASGAKATVHLGRLSGSAGFARTVAIKRLREQFVDDPDCASMFLEEARLAARIHHPNVVPTLDVLQSDDEMFLVMEYVHGESLARLIASMRAEKGHCDVQVVTSIMSGVLHGLHAAHDARDERGEPLNIVHRDMSPQSVLVGVDGVARVVDFGVAKALAQLQTRRHGQVKGKLQYMAPERVRNQAATRQSDIYSAAAVTWELLTGQALFANSQAAILTAVMESPIKAPSELAAHVPSELDRIVLRGLERDPTKRYQSALDMAAELERCTGSSTAATVGEWVESLAHDELAKRAELLADVERSSSGARAAVQVTSPSTTPEMPAEGSRSGVALVTSSPKGSSRLSALAALGVGAVLLSLAAIVFLSRRNASSTTATEAPSTSGTAASPAIASAPASSEVDVASPSSAAPSPSLAATSSATTRTAPPSSRAPRAGTTTNCDPPFRIDERGIKRYKPGCF